MKYTFILILFIFGCTKQPEYKVNIYSSSLLTREPLYQTTILEEDIRSIYKLKTNPLAKHACGTDLISKKYFENKKPKVKFIPEYYEINLTPISFMRIMMVLIKATDSSPNCNIKADLYYDGQVISGDLHINKFKIFSQLYIITSKDTTKKTKKESTHP